MTRQLQFLIFTEKNKSIYANGVYLDTIDYVKTVLNESRFWIIEKWEKHIELAPFAGGQFSKELRLYIDSLSLNQLTTSK